LRHVLALLDVTSTAGTAGSDGRFDERDVELFVQQFATAGGARDDSRYGPNGDGTTGGNGTDRFDLDFVRTYETVARATGTITRTVNEAAATDLDVLCHYAYTTLFTGDRTQREDLIGTECGLPPASAGALRRHRVVPGAECR
jgi:hypothetical protein